MAGYSALMPNKLRISIVLRYFKVFQLALGKKRFDSAEVTKNALNFMKLFECQLVRLYS